MMSSMSQQAIADAISHGNAILKFISPNDAGLTGGHQCGYYLPKNAWEMFCPFGPAKGQNRESEVTIQWPDGRKTKSKVKWYGKGTRSEYRLTCFGKKFPWLEADSVGNLLVLIPKNYEEFIAYVLDSEDDIEDIQNALGVEVIESVGLYRNGAPAIETETDCVERFFRQFASGITAFPSGCEFSGQARRAIEACHANFNKAKADDALMSCMEAEYKLFKYVERQLCESEIIRPFTTVDDFLQTAARIMNRRKSRAGRSLENHVDYILTRGNICHDMRPAIDGRPDVIIPSRAAYEDSAFPTNKLVVLGIKTTCKDRWRQVLNEGRRIPHKYILTTQKGISENQLREMKQANVTLVVPAKLHRDYPRQNFMPLLTVEDFLGTIRKNAS